MGLWLKKSAKLTFNITIDGRPIVQYNRALFKKCSYITKLIMVQ